MPSFLSFFLSFFWFFFDNCFLELEVVDPTILVAPPHCFFRLFFSFSFLFFFFLGLYNHSYNNWQRTILIDNQTKLLAATKHFCFLLFRFHNIDPGAEVERKVKYQDLPVQCRHRRCSDTNNRPGSCQIFYYGLMYILTYIEHRRTVNIWDGSNYCGHVVGHR